MRGLFLAGLTLALGGLVAHTSAEEIQWRPTGQKTQTKPLVSSQTPSDQPTNAANNPVKPVSFSGFNPSTTGVIFRAKNEVTKVNQPLPSGPVLEGPPPPLPAGEKVEVMPLPKAIPNTGESTGTDPNIIHSPPPGPIIYEGPIPPGAVYDSGCGDPDWSCCTTGGWCGRKKWWHCFNSCDTCTVPVFWARGEYLLWSTSQANLPPLVTSTNFNSAQITALQGLLQFGALGQPGTSVLFGGGDIDSPTFSGGRFTLGFGGRHHSWGFETTYFFLGEQSTLFSAASNSLGQPGLFSPFFNVETGTQAAQFFAFPGNLAGAGQLQGGVLVDHSTRLWGIEATIRKPLIYECDHKLDLLAGFRFLELNESLDIVRTAACVPELDQNCVVSDHFGTRNRFYGGQVGLDYEYRHCRWIFGVTGKLALGSVHQTALISGSTVVAPGIVPPTVPGGTLTKPSNIGRFNQDQFAVIPEVGLKIGYQITDHVNAFVAYNFLYVSSVARPGDQIDFGISPNQIVNRPAFNFNSTGFWAQGVNFGLECKY